MREPPERKREKQEKVIGKIEGAKTKQILIRDDWREEGNKIV